MRFSETMESLRRSGEGWTAQVGADWFQGRATFGGMVAALGNEAMRQIVPRTRELRGLEVTFVGPVLAGEVRITAEILRVGKAVTIAQARLWSEDQVVTTLTGIYGASRASAISIAAPPAGEIRRPEELPDADYTVANGSPAFLRHFQMRWAEGDRPYTGATISRSKVYFRHLDDTPLTESHIVALIDVIPSPALQMLNRFAPASSLIWSLEFLRHDHADYPPDGWWRIDTDVTAAADGYASHSSAVFDPGGQPAALSRQLVAVFG